MIIGLTGPIASGKTIAAEYLTKRGFFRLSLSDLVREETLKRHLPLERKVLQDVGNDLRDHFGAGILAKLALKRMTQGNWVVDGIRNPGEIEELRKSNSFVLIAMNAPLTVRFQRLLHRKKDSDPSAWHDFRALENRDRHEGGNGQAVEACMKLADVTISCKGIQPEELKECYAQLDNVLTQYL